MPIPATFSTYSVFVIIGYCLWSFVALEPRLLTRWEVQTFARQAYEMGVRYIGGCCGFEPYHIRAIAEEVHHSRHLPYEPRSQGLGTRIAWPSFRTDRHTLYLPPPLRIQEDILYVTAWFHSTRLLPIT